MNWYLAVLKKYTDFNGRARRSEYWYFFLFNTLINVVLILVGKAVLGNDILRIVYTLAVLLPSIGVAIRRMHDVDKSGWYVLIPFYNFVLACTEGTRGDNEYGPDPKENPGAEVV
ncbi:MAG: DUF805 domain-containing protein [Cytophagaceae bacterium]|jgi:uncharacterized membrane protein YhaH (DUF805 family)